MNVQLKLQKKSSKINKKLSENLLELLKYFILGGLGTDLHQPQIAFNVFFHDSLNLTSLSCDFNPPSFGFSNSTIQVNS